MKNLKIAAIVAVTGVASFLLGVGTGAATDSVHPRTEAAVRYDPTPAIETVKFPIQPAVVDDGVIRGGTYEVGVDIAPGTYKTAGPTADDVVKLCIWQRKSNDSGELSSIIASHMSGGADSVTVKPSDKFISLTGCTWHKK